jgi:uncharacterized protein YggE
MLHRKVMTMMPTKLFMAFAAVFVVVTLSLLVAVNDQRQAVYVSNSGTKLSAASFADSLFGGSAWAAEVTDKTLFVSGSASAAAAPDKVTIQFSVVTDDDSAEVSQQENAVKTAAVRTALIAAGIPASDIETTGYSLYQMRDYNYETGATIDRGYRTSHSMKVEISDISQAGIVIDAAVSGGANAVDGVYFGLSDEKTEELTMQALEAAGKNAKDKADAVATGLGVTVSRLMSATEGYTYTPLYSSYDVKMESASAGGSAPTSVTPGDISVTATVSAVFEIA